LIFEQDTIAAIATPFGEGGIGIIRISGPLAESISKHLFRPKKNESHLSHQFHYGEIVDPERGVPIDEVLFVFMKSPKTYTREDVVEIHCHGGYLALQRVLELVLRQGARMAQPGEFTKRAFLNGRIDLTQAEAVVDLIRAKTMASLEIANQQLKGMLHKEIGTLKESLIQHLTLIEAHIDFPEEDLDPIFQETIEKDLQRMIERIYEMISTYEEGKIFKEGISCAIIGKTNVGKSSLLNILLREDRAIVTPIPGTTRDVIEEVLNIHEIPVRLLDTAGLRKTVDPVEVEGVRRTRERVAESDLVILVLDGSRSTDADDLEISREIEKKKRVIVINKKDLPLVISVDDVKGRFPGDPIVLISALKNEGIDLLKDAIYRSLIHRDVRTSPEYLIVANIRHKDALVRTKDGISNALRGLQDGISPEFVAFEIRSSLEAVGEIIGETASEEILHRIFERFCIGK
jgi:tRNA modification GTPase